MDLLDMHVKNWSHLLIGLESMHFIWTLLMRILKHSLAIICLFVFVNITMDHRTSKTSLPCFHMVHLDLLDPGRFPKCYYLTSFESVVQNIIFTLTYPFCFTNSFCM